nr:MAG TPA: hypothetical protein [Caudoviricetes sp.]
MFTACFSLIQPHKGTNRTQFPKNKNVNVRPDFYVFLFSDNRC